MVTSYYKIVCFGLLLLSASGIMLAQTTTNRYAEGNCSAELARADSDYKNGLYDECILSLENTLRNCRLTRREKEYCLETLAKASLETDDKAKAESYVELLLTAYPHYELIENENFEAFNRLVKKYRIHPALSLGVRNAAVWRRYSTSEVFSLPGGPANTEPYVTPGYFFSYYGWGEIEFDHGISLNGELMWWTSTINRYVSGKTNVDLNYWEYQEYVEIPVYVRKYFTSWKNVLHYFAAGAGWVYMTKASGNVNNYNESDDKNYIYNNIDVYPMRNRNNLEWVVGAGIGYKIKNLRFFGDLRYFGGITSLNNPERRLDNEVLMNDFSYIDNSMKMNKFEIGVSISYTFINSVKRTRF